MKHPPQINLELCVIQNNLGPIRNWGVELIGNHIKVNRCMETNFPGVYAAGDIIARSEKMNLISTGFADAAIAVKQAYHFIRPENRFHLHPLISA